VKVKGINRATPIEAESPGRAPTMIPAAVLRVIATIFAKTSVPERDDAKCSNIFTLLCSK
jgi:hypothetical protein